MKALSLWQPWASAMALGAKRNETRSWPAISGGHLYRGWVAICAAKTQKDTESKEPLKDTFEEWLHDPEIAVFFSDALELQWETLPFGKIVAVGWLQDSLRTEGLEVTPLEYSLGGYGPGRYAWQFTEMWRLNVPLPVRGEQKLFDVEMPANWQDQAIRVF